VDLFRPEPDVEQAKALRDRITATNPSLEDIERDAEAGFLLEVQSIELGTPVLVR
jgi:hypothetical protein